MFLNYNTTLSKSYNKNCHQCQRLFLYKLVTQNENWIRRNVNKLRSKVTRNTMIATESFMVASEKLELNQLLSCVTPRNRGEYAYDTHKLQSLRRMLFYVIMVKLTNIKNCNHYWCVINCSSSLPNKLIMFIQLYLNY